MYACICTFTNQQDVIVAEAHRTLAAEAADLIDACSMGTDPRNLPALVNIWIMTHISVYPSCDNKHGFIDSCYRILLGVLPMGFPVWISMMKPGAGFPHRSSYSATHSNNTIINVEKMAVEMIEFWHIYYCLLNGIVDSHNQFVHCPKCYVASYLSQIRMFP